MKKKKLFLILATAIMLIMTACSGAFVDPGMQDSNSGGSSNDDGYNNGDGGGGDDYNNGGGGGGGKPADCSSYQSKYNDAKSSVEFYKRSLTAAKNELSTTTGSFEKITAQSRVERVEIDLLYAEAILGTVEAEAKSAGCSI